MTTTHCSHHWKIKAPDGPVSKGRCRLCGEEREFSNTSETKGGWTRQTRESWYSRKK